MRRSISPAHAGHSLGAFDSRWDGQVTAALRRSDESRPIVVPFAQLRELFLGLKADVWECLAAPSTLARAGALRTAGTGAPARNFAGDVLLPRQDARDRLAFEAAFCALFLGLSREALRQWSGVDWRHTSFAQVVPETSAYSWYRPPPRLALDLARLCSAMDLTCTPSSIAGDLYERALTTGERKALGEFYTPAPIAQHLLDLAGYTADTTILQRSFLDVAIGFGVFCQSPGGTAHLV